MILLYSFLTAVIILGAVALISVCLSLASEYEWFVYIGIAVCLFLMTLLVYSVAIKM